MFKTQNFCHIASNNRNQVKAGVFVYRTTDDLATVSASGYFNARIIDINLHDLIIHEKIDAADATKVERNVLCVTERTLENVGVIVIKSKWEGDIEQEIADLKTYVDNNFVNIDGSSIMSGPLKFRAGSFEGAIAGGLGDGISVYKLKADGSIDSEVASLTKTNGFVPGTNNAMDIGRNNLKWKDAYIARVITSILNNGADITVPSVSGTMALISDIAIKSTEAEITNPTDGQWLQYDGNNLKWKNVSLTPANTDLSNLTATGQGKFDAKANVNMDNLTSVGQNISNWSSNVSNCITNIPQDIKLELNNGTLTLKAGSKVYVPNGAGVFDEVVIANDINLNTSSNSTSNRMVFYKNDGTLYSIAKGQIFSGSSQPTVGLSINLWYDTTNNVIKRTTDTGSTWTNYGLSLPLCIAPSTNGVGFTSIDQVFNGFGYIGLTVFALPGLKVLIPDGKNSDGTLKNTEFATSNVLTVTSITGNDDECVVISSYGLGRRARHNYTYNKEENRNKYVGVNDSATPICCYNRSSGYISNFNYKTVFHTVDYSDTQFIANQAMPSNKYIDLTLGASGASYTAPADGYVYICKVAQEFPREVLIANDAPMTSQIISSANGQWLRAWLPVRKGAIFKVTYDITGTTVDFKFIYANGAQ